MDARKLPYAKVPEKPRKKLAAICN
jgi:hypothetical protein